MSLASTGASSWWIGLDRETFHRMQRERQLLLDVEPPGKSKAAYASNYEAPIMRLPPEFAPRPKERRSA